MSELVINESTCMRTGQPACECNCDGHRLYRLTEAVRKGATMNRDDDDEEEQEQDDDQEDRRKKKRTDNVLRP